MREKLLEDLEVINFLLKTSAASQPDVGALLRGQTTFCNFLILPVLCLDFKNKLFLYMLNYTKKVISLQSSQKTGEVDPRPIYMVSNHYRKAIQIKNLHLINVQPV